jgi:hypothetical protein
MIGGRTARTRDTGLAKNPVSVPSKLLSVPFINQTCENAYSSLSLKPATALCHYLVLCLEDRLMKRLLSNAVFNRVPSNRLRLVWIAFFCVGWNFLLHQVAVSGDDGIGSIFAQTAPQGTTKRLRQVPAATQGAELDREISQVRFVEPLKAKVALFSADNKFTEIVTIPSRHDFERSTTYRLRVSQIASRPGLTLYPTLQIYPAHPASADYLREQQLKVAITDHDLDYVETGGYLRKVLYLVDPKYQSRPLPGQDSLTEIVSTAATDMGTKLDPGVDPIIEANRRGKILYVLRMGTIDMGSMDRERHHSQN